MTGALFLIGGHEDREGDRLILREFAGRCGDGPVALLTAASGRPERYVTLYQGAFAPLGIEVVELEARTRAEADRPDGLSLLERCGGVFISGGNQVRAMETLGGSAAAARLRERWAAGMPVAGTSAGASVLGERMVGRGSSDDSPDPGELETVEGLGLLKRALVDQHLAQRGRIPRLLAASVIDGCMAIGVDENTAAVVIDAELTVVGVGTVTLIDPSSATAAHRPTAVSIRGAVVDVVVQGDEPVDLASRGVGAAA